MFRLCSLTLLAISTSVVCAGHSGYSYEKPTSNGRPSDAGYDYPKPPTIDLRSTVGSGGHYFPPLATVRPLPAVPDLPPLPTPRPRTSTHQQTIYQTHPQSSQYSPPQSGIGKIVQQYLPPSGGLTPPSAQAGPPTGQSGFGNGGFGNGGFGNGGFGNGYVPPSGSDGLIFGTFGPHTGSGVFGPHAPPQQPLRIPFGKSAVINFPSGQTGPGQFRNGGNGGNGGNGARLLKQYAVVEIIDNDIMQNTQPFLPAPIRNEARAQFGASGTGAAPPTGGVQISSAANSALLGQQRLAAQNSDSISLGSGSLGLVRLPNGNVFLGSGSLGYISGQQKRDNVNEARTRSEMVRANAVHFGHGSLADSPISGSAATFPQRF